MVLKECRLHARLQAQFRQHPGDVCLHCRFRDAQVAANGVIRQAFPQCLEHFAFPGCQRVHFWCGVLAGPVPGGEGCGDNSCGDFRGDDLLAGVHTADCVGDTRRFGTFE